MQEAGGNRPLALRGFGLGNVFNQEKKGIINSSYTVSNIFTKQTRLHCITEHQFLMQKILRPGESWRDNLSIALAD